MSSSVRLFFGLIIQAFFNSLDTQIHFQHPSLTIGIWLLIGFLVLASLLRSLIVYVGARSQIVYDFLVRFLLQLNLLRRLFELPSAYALPDSVGNVISYFRDDTQVIGLVLEVIARTVALVLFTIAAIVILLSRQDVSLEYPKANQ